MSDLYLSVDTNSELNAIISSVTFELKEGFRRTLWEWCPDSDESGDLVAILREILEVIDGTPPAMPAFVGMVASGVGTLSEEAKPQGVPWGSGKEDDLPIVG